MYKGLIAEVGILLLDPRCKPEYATEGSSGFDLRYFTTDPEPIVLKPGEKRLLNTGCHFVLPPGTELQIRPRSGTSWKTDLRIGNSPGTIDCDYTGEVLVNMHNIGSEEFTIKPFERIAQAVLCPVYRASFTVLGCPEDLPSTERGAGGHGSTGTA